MPPSLPPAPSLSYAEMEDRLANRPKPLVLSDGRELAYLYRAQNGAGHWHIFSELTQANLSAIPQEDLRNAVVWFREAQAFVDWAETEMLAEADRCREYNQLELSRKSSHPLVRKHDYRRFP